jgi:surface carbohydrate biosynthesis protein
MTKIKKLFKIILTIKFKFSKPLKRKILIYDEYSIKFSKVLFKKKNYEILRTRFEEINLFILITTIFKHGFVNLIFNYGVEYIKYVNPKIVFTSIDNDLNFYKLKSISSINKYNYISSQNGMRDNKFYNICLKFLKDNKQNLLCDHIFVFNNPEKKRLSNVIQAKIHVVGNIINNSLKKSFKKESNSVTFISNGLGEGQNANLSLEKKIFSNLLFLSKKFNFTLNFMDRPGQNNKTHQYNFYRKKLPKGSWKYYNFSKNNINKYKFIDNQKIFIFRRSTLGYELMARGKKIISIEKNFPIFGHNKKFKKNGFFWINSWKTKLFGQRFKEVMKMSKNKWLHKTKLFKNEIMAYDENNNKIKHIIRFIIN